MGQHRDEAVGIAGRAAARAWLAFAGDPHAHFVVDASRNLNFSRDFFQNLAGAAAGGARMLDHRALAVTLRASGLDPHDAGRLNYSALATAIAAYLAAAPAPDADAFLASVPRPFVLVHPGAGRADKAWGEERFAHLARGLVRERGIAAIVSWGPGDERRAERLRALLPKRPPMPLLGYAGLARVIRASALFVAGDTGPLHLADALGVRTLALFGPTDSARNGPYRDRRGVVTRMHEVSDDTVLARALELLRVESPGSGV